MYFPEQIQQGVEFCKKHQIPQPSLFTHSNKLLCFYYKVCILENLMREVEDLQNQLVLHKKIFSVFTVESLPVKDLDKAILFFRFVRVLYISSLGYVIFPLPPTK